ncbi:MAG: hypothetical protein ACE5E1_06035 [Phycisphaerae bacterium]
MQPRILLKLEGLAFALVLVAGCSHLNNPYKDSSAAIEGDMTTASAEGYKGKAEFPPVGRRNWAAATVYLENGATSHWPLWFEDPFEDKGNRWHAVADCDEPDNRFVREWTDYFHMVYGPARMLLNIGAYPISMAVQPPGTLMESDGRIDARLGFYDHDAKRSNRTAREPPDVNAINKKPPVVDGAPDPAAG